MEASLPRSARPLDLIQVLRRRQRPVPAAELAAELRVSLRTIYRDIGTLQAQGAPIDGDAGSGYVLRPEFLLPPLIFGDDEMDAVILGLSFVVQCGDADLASAAEDALAKIEAVLPPGNEGILSASPLLGADGESSETPHLGVIRKAIREERKLFLSYTDKKGSASKRVIWPVSIDFFGAGEMLAAWCETRGDFRHFRLDRIVAITPMQERLPKRHRILVAEWRLSQDLVDMP